MDIHTKNETNIFQHKSSQSSSDVTEIQISQEHNPETYLHRLQQTGNGRGYKDCRTQGERVEQILKQKSTDTYRPTGRNVS